MWDEHVFLPSFDFLWQGWKNTLPIREVDIFPNILSSIALIWDIFWLNKYLSIEHTEGEPFFYLKNLNIYTIEITSHIYRSLSSPVLITVCRVGGGLVAKSCLTLATPWTAACQAPLSMEFPRQNYWSGLQFPTPWSSRPRDQTGISCVSCTSRQILYHRAIWEASYFM